MNFRKMNLLAIILAVCLCTAALANTSTIGQTANFDEQATMKAANLDVGNGCANLANMTNTGFVLDNIPAAVNFNEANLANTNTATVSTAPQANLARHRWDQAAVSNLTQNGVMTNVGYGGNGRHRTSACRAESAANSTWMNHLTLAGLGSPPNASNTSTAAIPANLSQNSNFA